MFPPHTPPVLVKNSIVFKWSSGSKKINVIHVELGSYNNEIMSAKYVIIYILLSCLPDRKQIFLIMHRINL